MLKEQRRNLASGRTSEGGSNNHEDMMNLFAPEIHAANINHDE